MTLISCSDCNRLSAINETVDIGRKWPDSKSCVILNLEPWYRSLLFSGAWSVKFYVLCLRDSVSRVSVQQACTTYGSREVSQLQKMMQQPDFGYIIICRSKISFKLQQNEMDFAARGKFTWSIWPFLRFLCRPGAQQMVTVVECTIPFFLKKGTHSPRQAWNHRQQINWYKFRSSRRCRWKSKMLFFENKSEVCRNHVPRELCRDGVCPAPLWGRGPLYAWGLAALDVWGKGCLAWDGLGPLLESPTTAVSESCAKRTREYFHCAKTERSASSGNKSDPLLPESARVKQLSVTRNHKHRIHFEFLHLCRFVATHTQSSLVHAVKMQWKTPTCWRQNKHQEISIPERWWFPQANNICAISRFFNLSNRKLNLLSHDPEEWPTSTEARWYYYLLLHATKLQNFFLRFNLTAGDEG